MLGHLINHPKTLEKSSSFFVIHETAMAPEPAFSPDQLTWIIYKYSALKCVIKVMRAFRIKFCPNNRKDMPSRMSFYRAVKRFESSGGNAKPKERSGRNIKKMLLFISSKCKLTVFFSLKIEIKTK